MTRRRITPEERALWRRTTRSVRPIHDNSILGDHDDDSDETILKKAHASKPAVAVNGAGRRMAPPHAHGRVSSRISGGASSAPDPFRAGDPKAERRVRRGRQDIDATFDLHGHTQSSARAALYGFLLEARARNYACVLIITGKGVRPDVATGGAGVGGVLRARFKDWVREEAFRQHIVRVSPAHDRHGGGGAFYVFLKRRK